MIIRSPISGKNPQKWWADPSMVKSVLLLVTTAGFFFYVGVMCGIHFGYSQAESECKAGINKAVNKRLHLKSVDGDSSNALSALGILSDTEMNDLEPRFENGMKSYLSGMSVVSRNAFNQKFDMGVPLDFTKPNNNRILIVHGGDQSLPRNPIYSTYAKSNKGIPYIDDVEDAVENCQTLDVIMTDPSRNDQCLAIMGQYNSYHIQHFMRVPHNNGTEEGEAVEDDPNAKYPLRLVNRNANKKGGMSVHIPPQRFTNEYRGYLQKYLNHLEDQLAQLKPLAEEVAIKKTVIVMVVNLGQSDLLFNFVCSCKAKSISLKNILVFATDPETKEIAKGLGLKAFFDEKNYHKYPKESAHRYADKVFTRIMLAKVWCVHMMMELGYNVLFQDVDMIWYRHPLEYFLPDIYEVEGQHEARMHDNMAIENEQHDMYFQEDGNHGNFYAPYSANTGFYFVRYNDKTRYFFDTLLMTGDLVLSTKSHQVPIAQLLAEHASLFGLRVKVLPAHDGLFPGGYTFHSHKKAQYMKDLMQDKLAPHDVPYIFHMSWTHSKDNKVKFFKQMGQWFVKQECAGVEANRILANHAGEFRGGNLGPGYLTGPCCYAQPQFECFYKDKPSLEPCKSSPAIDKGGKSFWS